MSVPLVDLNGRVRDRAREQRQRLVRIIGRVLAALAVFAVLGWVATASPLFSVRTVVVTGNRAVTSDTITRAAGVPIGLPLAQVDGTAVARRVGEVPGVGRGDVTVSLPDTVTIHVVERAVAFVVATNGGYAWVDATGVRFNQTAQRPAGVPLAQADVGDPQLLADVATVVGALPRRLAAKLDHLAAPTRDSMVVATTDKAQIVWGSVAASALKGQVLDALSQSNPTCRYVDVSSPAHPTTRC